MNGKNKNCKKLVSVALVMLLGMAVMANSAHYVDGTVSLLNPWNPANMAVEKVVDRTLQMGTTMPHAGADDFSSLALFTDYDFGNSNDKRTGGFNSYMKSTSIGADTMYKGSTLFGAIFNYTDAKGDNEAGTNNKLYAQTATVYMAQPLSDWLTFGTSLSYSDSICEVSNTNTDTDSIVLAPYLSAMTKMDKWTLSLTPAYIVGYQKANYSANSDDDASWMGKLSVMSRASYAVSDKMSISGSLAYNQVLHNHALDNENDSDHHWFTYGTKVNYKLTSNLSTAFGYNSELDSDFDSDMWVANMTYLF